ncbi:Ig-like domain-containing protein [Mycobacterium sp. ACS4331]|uniref:Ig-like domain-containing protein n=1 Tax=Mycobacterium sp. ACS4331 TaxID=1834121 RepID=UPI000800A02A|nr:Ig-like domain-containing protein [Mycobacterium sp. ACS4331]OBF25071.1 hypothetical protein A5727_05910 [Mycobacterium sp. ACS4331]
MSSPAETTLDGVTLGTARADIEAPNDTDSKTSGSVSGEAQDAATLDPRDIATTTAELQAQTPAESVPQTTTPEVVIVEEPTPVPVEGESPKDPDSTDISTPPVGEVILPDNVSDNGTDIQTDNGTRALAHTTSGAQSTTTSPPEASTLDPSDPAAVEDSPLAPEIEQASQTTTAPPPAIRRSNPLAGLIAIPVAAVVAVPAVVSAAISAILSPLLSPGVPAAPPFLWNVLTWAVREIQNTFFNRRPRVVAQTIELSLDAGQVSGPISFGGFDPDGNPVTYTVSTPEHGVVTVDQQTGQFTYTLTDPGYTGTDQFTVTISDAGMHLHGLHGRVFNHTSSAVITLDITAPNRAPVAVPEHITTEFNTPVTFSVLDNDFDPDDDALTVISYTDPVHGTLVHHGDGIFTYTPNPGFSGEDEFTYTIGDEYELMGAIKSTFQVFLPEIHLHAEDDEVTLDEDDAVTVDVLANDTSGDVGHLQIVDVSVPSHGTATLNPDNTITYVPTTNHNGTDSFTYTVYDAAGNAATATVSLIINPVNDAPTGVSVPQVTVDEDGTVSGVITAVDPEGGPLVFSLDEPPQHGTVTVDESGAFVYVPDLNYNGTDVFGVHVTDSEGATTSVAVPVTIHAVDDVPEAPAVEIQSLEDTAVTGALLPTGVDVDGEHVTLHSIGGQPVGAGGTTTIVTVGGVLTVTADGQFAYAPNADFAGTETVEYTVIDESGSTATSTLTFHIQAVNDAPVANDDMFGTSPGVLGLTSMTFTGNVLDNDTDVDNPRSDLTAFLVGSPTSIDNPLLGLDLQPITHFQLLPDGTFVIEGWVPGGLLGGLLVPVTWTFTYVVDDGEALSEVATATVRWT